MRRITDIFHTAAVQMAVIVGLAMVALLTCGCRRVPDERLLHAQSMMEEHPDSALRLLEGISLPEGAPEHDRALHALLLTHARYKNYIDETGDSLIRIAAEYFGKHGPAEEASKALFLLGKIQMNAKRYGEAAVSLSRGLDLAKANGIHLWEGHCADGLFSLYGEFLNSSAQIKYADIASEAFSAAGDDEQATWSRMEMAIAYGNNRKFQKADSIAKELSGLAREKSDTALMEAAALMSGTALHALGQYGESLQSYAHAYQLNPTSLAKKDLTLISLSASGVSQDSISPEIREFIRMVASKEDYAPSFSVLAEEERYKEAYYSLMEYKNAQDSVLNMILDNNVAEAVGRYEEASRISAETRREKGRILAISVIVVLSLLAVLVYMFFRIRWLRNKRAMEKRIADIESIRKDLQLRLEKAERNIEEPANKGKAMDFMRMLKTKYSYANRFCDKYYESPGSAGSEDAKDVIANFTNAEFLVEVEKNIDSVSDGLYSSFKSEFPDVKDDGCRLFLYLMLGFGNRSLAVLLRAKVNTIATRKSRLKKDIEKSGASRKEEYLKVIG